MQNILVALFHAITLVDWKFQASKKIKNHDKSSRLVCYKSSEIIALGEEHTEVQVRGSQLLSSRSTFLQSLTPTLNQTHLN